MTFPEMAAAILRKWWVFVLALVVLVPLAVSLRSTGAEFIGDSWVTVTLPRQDNTLLESADVDYRAPAILAAVAVQDDSYRETLRDDGLPDTFEVDYGSQFPVVIITVRGSDPILVGDALERISEEYVRQITVAQSSRDVVDGAQVSGTLTAVAYPYDRPPGSRNAFVGLLFGAVMLAAALAYAADQFGPSMAALFERESTDGGGRGPVELGTPS